MVALRLIRLIETHSGQIAGNVATNIRASRRTSNLQNVPESEMVAGMQELLQHLSEWLLTKTDTDIQNRYREIGARRAGQGIALADSCWAVTMTKEYLWEFLQKQGFLCSAIEIYGEMELLRLLGQFFDRALCYVVEGYKQSRCSQPLGQTRNKNRELNLAGFVP